MRALPIVLACALGCTKPAAPAPAQSGPKKPRVDITVWLDPKAEVPAGDIAVATGAPPKARQMLERSGIHFALLGMPSDADPAAFLKQAIPEAEAAGSNATVVVTARCLADVEPALHDNVAPFWTVALVVGAPCERQVTPAVGAAALVEAGKASRVRITFDRHTRAFLKVEPIR